MLTPEYLEQVGSDLSDLYYDLETEIMADIAERLKINGDRMTTTAEYLVMKLEQMGYQHEYIQRRLVSIMNISEQKVSQILEDSTYQSMRDSLQRAKTYESVDGSTISFDEQILQSKTAINAELKNLTNSTARMATNTMLRTFDNAYMKVSSGAYSLNQAVDQAIKELIDTGIGQVTYRSGTKRNIDTAVRVAVRTGVNQNALKCEEQVLESTGHNLVVVSAHMGARPSHAEWQGKIYWRDHPEGDYENFEEATGYGTGAGLGGWNCRHQFFAYYPEMGNPYEDVDTKGNQEVYELTQQQRYNERMIRKWKRRKEVYGKAGLDTTLENQKIREWVERNNALIKSSKYLKRQYANEKSYTVHLSITGNDFTISGKSTPAEKSKALRDGRLRAIEKGDISALVTQKTYNDYSKRIFDNLIGVTTKDGILITGTTTHFIDRCIGNYKVSNEPITKDKVGGGISGTRKGASIRDVKYCITKGECLGTREQENGLRSNVYRSDNCQVSVNPDTHELIQTQVLSKRKHS